jgi:predicted dehydrogenase
MTSHKLNIGIIGCGGIAGTKHLPALAKLGERVELTAFCDLKEERAAEAAKRYDASRRWKHRRGTRPHAARPYRPGRIPR